MTRNQTRKLAREHLDAKLARLKDLKIPNPSNGWIRTIREALGISQATLARHLKITAQSLVDIEKNEQNGKISFQTLQRVADALGCELTYALIPRIPLSQKLKQQALATAKQIVERTHLHMSLENQGPNTKFKDAQVKDLAEELIRNNDKRIWEVL